MASSYPFQNDVFMVVFSGVNKTIFLSKKTQQEFQWNVFNPSHCLLTIMYMYHASVDNAMHKVCHWCYLMVFFLQNFRHFTQYSKTLFIFCKCWKRKTPGPWGSCLCTEIQLHCIFTLKTNVVCTTTGGY